MPSSSRTTRGEPGAGEALLDALGQPLDRALDLLGIESAIRHAGL